MNGLLAALALTSVLSSSHDAPFSRATTPRAVGQTSIVALAAFDQPPRQDEFVPVSELPPSEQLPAARLLVVAYAFAWVAILGFLWSIWTRLGRVERELGDVRSRHAGKGRPSA